MNWKKNAIFLFSVIICCIPIFLTFNKGINYFDEGYILEGARRIAVGEVPYRDFHFIYTPGTVYFLALFFRICGQHIIVERLAGALVSIVGVIFLGLLTRNLTKNSLLTILTMFLYVLWGPAHLNFFWPVMCVIPLLFVYLFLLRKSHLFLAGVVAALILLCKQNFGAALVISFLCYLVFARYSKRQILTVCFGFVSVITFFMVHLLITQSLIPFIADINTYTIQVILVHKAFAVPFPVQTVGKFALYAFPGIASFIICIWLMVQKKNRTLLFIPLTLLAVYLLGIFPTPDWTHLMPLISIVGILFALLPRIFGERARFISYFYIFFAICVALYSLFVRNYYRWEAPLIKHTHCFSSGRMKYMCIDEKNYAVITQTLASINKEAPKGTYIFAFYNNPIYYFLTQKNNPTRFIDFNFPGGTKEENNIVGQLRQKKVAIIITRFSPSASQSKIISGYIEENYLPIKGVYEFTVWKYKN